MKKLIYIGIIAVFFTACATYQKPLIDDAYYWSDDPEIHAHATESGQIEYLNVQDTTVTIRIKR